MVDNPDNLNTEEHYVVRCLPISLPHTLPNSSETVWQCLDADVKTAVFHARDQKPSATRRSCKRRNKKAVRAEFSRVNASRLQLSLLEKSNFSMSISNEAPGDAQGLEERELGSDTKS